MTEVRRISIWFFIGTLLLLYGIIITGSGIYEVVDPNFGRDTVLRGLDFGLWWGILLIIVGLIYFIGFRPWKKNNANT